MNNALNISPVPHVRDRWTTKFIMYTVILSLLPATVVGIAMNGLHAFYVVLCSVATAVLTEYIFDYFAGKPDTWLDGSAVEVFRGGGALSAALEKTSSTRRLPQDVSF